MPTKPSNVVPLKRTTRQQQVDGWINIITGLGLSGKDKRLGASYAADTLTEEEAEELWLGDDMAAKAIETVPGEIIRAGWSMQIEPDLDGGAPVDDPTNGEDPGEAKLLKRKKGPPARPGRSDLATTVFPEPEESAQLEDGKALAEEIDAECEDLEMYSVVQEALEYARAYGGSGILLGARDGSTDLTKPLDLARVKSLDWLTALQPRELVPVRWYRDPRKKGFGRPEIYRIQQDTAAGGVARLTVDVHESRIVRFDGIVVSRRQVRTNKGWGTSVLSRMNGVLRDFHMSWNASAILLNDFSQAVFKMKGLAELLAANDPAADATVINRAKVIELARSVARALLIDSEEEFERKTTNIAGLPEMLEQFCLRLAAAADIPVTRLMGQSPAGLNATGASDIRFFYDSIDRERERKLRPRLNRIYKVLFAAKEGPSGGSEPANWSVKFGPLWQLDAIQEADRRLKNAQADSAYVTAGVLVPEEVAVSRFGGEKYGEDITLDQRIRDEFDQQASEEAEKQAAELQALAKNGGNPLQTSAKPGAPTSTPPKPSVK